MAWLAVDKDGSEIVYGDKPYRYDWLGEWCCEIGVGLVYLPKGTIKKPIGKELTWSDEPVKLE